MRNIQKQTEPISLMQHRCNQHADYDNYSYKQDLRKSLENEQRGICCYCMQRIRPSENEMKIEHWQCQALYPKRQLDYSNLLGACQGGKGKRLGDQHCDTKKADSSLSYSPASHDIEVKLRYLGDGKIQSDDAQLQLEIEQVLNLNNSLLVKNRKGVLDAFKERLQKDQASNTDLKKELDKWNGKQTGKLEPFCQVVVYYLRKKLKSP